MITVRTLPTTVVLDAAGLRCKADKRRMWIPVRKDDKRRNAMIKSEKYTKVKTYSD
ncbi:hypothetical protein GCM10022226_02130 [Sphaerisporangium flaviroseum]|uniref:Uncharacterized protein n=1 Tax=Sphaerisporangium flaviroseum TaxID=509199 RepID=A0ABP7HA69_9ACTN